MNVEFSALIKNTLDFNTVAAAYGLEFNRMGFARCPFHNEKTASFKIKNHRMAHCFGCGWSGDIIDFTGKLFNLNFKQSMQKLVSDFNLPITLNRKMTLRETRDITAAYNAAVAERKRRKQAEEEKQKRYDNLLWVYATLDRWKREFKPRSPSDSLDERYVIACKELDGAGYRLMLYS